MDNCISVLTQKVEVSPFIPDLKTRRFLLRLFLAALFPFEFWRDIFTLDLNC